MKPVKLHVRNEARSDLWATWCGRPVIDVTVIDGSFNWEDPRICGSCYRRAEEAQIRDARRWTCRHCGGQQTPEAPCACSRGRK